MKKSCAIFFYEGYLDIAPTLISLLKTLNQRGYSVTFYVTSNKNSNPIAARPNTKIVHFRHSAEIPLISLCRSLMTKMRLGSCIPIIDLVVFEIQFFIHLLLKYLFDRDEFRQIKDDSFNLGIDKQGSILAFLKSRSFNQEHFYLSLELIDPKSLGRLVFITGIVNQLERLAYREAKCVLIQDEIRFRALTQYNQHLHPQAFYLPNSLCTMEDAFSSDCKYENYFRRLFQLCKDKYPYIILQAGMIAPEVYSEEIAQAFTAINEGCALIFNAATAMSLNNPYIQTLKAINQRNLFLSLNPVPYERLSEVYRSATIGLALYRGDDPNFSEIAKASGKLANYLQYGKPVIVNALPSLVDLVDQYEFGIAINNPSDPTEIITAIKKILANYNYYCQNARYCFEMEYDFQKKVQPFLSFIEP